MKSTAVVELLEDALKSRWAQWILVCLTPPTLASVGIALAALRSSFAIPKDDDWSYLAVTLEWAERGHLTLNGWVHMMFVSQGALGTAIINTIGPSVWVLNILVVLTGIGGLFVVYWLSRNLLSQGFSLLVVAVAGLSPLWLRLSVSYMTDVPAWALAGLSLALGVYACRRSSCLWLTLAAVMGLLALGVREYAAVPLVSLLIWVLLRTYPRCFKRWALILLLLVSLLGVIAFFWRQTLPGSIATTPASPLEAVHLACSLVLTCALLMAPYLFLGLILVWPLKANLFHLFRKYWVGTFVGLFLGLGVAAASSMRLVGNVIHPYGSSWTSVGDGVRSIPLGGFRAVTLLAVVSLVLMLAFTGMILQRWATTKPGKLLERPRSSSSLVGLYIFISVALMAVYFVAILVVGAPAFDRYLLLIVPLFGIVVLWSATRCMQQTASRWQKSAVASLLVVTGFFGIVITDGLNQVDGLRWQVASTLVQDGVPAYKIDGGDAWFRFHQKDAPGVAEVGSLENSIPGRTWWQTFFKGSTFCRMVAIESETDLQAMYGRAISIQEERTLLGTPFRIMVFAGPDPC